MTYFTEDEYAHVNKALDLAGEMLNHSMKLLDAVVGLVSEVAALKGQAYMIEAPKVEAENAVDD